MVLHLELHTAGWSGNEDIINALLENRMFTALWYKQWKTGGHYWFELNPVNLGYSTVQQYCKENGISRQGVYHTKDKFDWIEISHNKKMLKRKALQSAKG